MLWLAGWQHSAITSTSHTTTYGHSTGIIGYLECNGGSVRHLLLLLLLPPPCQPGLIAWQKQQHLHSPQLLLFPSMMASDA
jgi:hypothetical protein